MKEQIIIKSTELFSNLGIKSVTMDDIAREMGISKKTIYQYFETKTKLVEATAIYKFDCINNSINSFCNIDGNPLDEIFKMKEFIINQLNNEKPSAQYQFKKYYPRIFAILKQKQFEITKNCITNNLERGMQQGWYRTNLNKEFIARIYFNFMVSFNDPEIFPLDLFSKQQLLHDFLDYHLRGICSEQGINYLNTFNQTPTKN